MKGDNLSTEQLIKIIGPALRGIKAEGTRLPLVRYSEEPVSGGVSCVVKADSLPDDIIKTLRKSVNDSVSAVNVEGVGSFTCTATKKTGGRVDGKVACVTGAAQGFGFEIACALAEQGAMLVLGDINIDGVTAAAEKINSKAGADIAIGIAMNVTNAGSVSDGITAAVKRFGGLDLFVANAGVVKAGSVKEIPERDFDFVTNVNYKGYFLCVQNAAPVMSVQHKANSESWSDIIQINSKSGLAGSNKNGAYAGSKFGGIGLTQSFALELVEDGIKVNSVCPGNFLDGPLWSDPENGLFAQYLRSGKVPGAKTIADVRHFYESKVPVGRGCTTGDVMKAVFYAVDQMYETGQALPVTGGQEMLK